MKIKPAKIFRQLVVSIIVIISSLFLQTFVNMKIYLTEIFKLKIAKLQ